MLPVLFCCKKEDDIKVIPAISITAVTNITATSATNVENVTSNVGVAVTSRAVCWVNNLITYKAPYGAFYNWITVNTGKLCPSDWHVPFDAEGTTLANFRGGTGVAGAKLKEAGTMHWQAPNAGATNETGFTALPGGFRYWGGTFTDFGFAGYWWISKAVDGTHSVCCYLSYTSLLYNANEYIPSGASVRCIKD